MAKKSLIPNFLFKHSRENSDARKSGGKKLLSSKQKSSEKKGQAAAASAAKTQDRDGAELKLVFFIVDWQCANVVSNVCVEEKVRFHFTSAGMGTANSEILDLLGIGSKEKAVVTCLEQEVGVSVLMREVRKKLKSYGPGAGIAFTVPLSAINDPVLLIFKQSILKNEKIAAGNSGEGVNMTEKFSHDLILCIVSHGYSDEVMNTARAAGATGGTVINARGQAHEGAVKFFGVSVQDEKELILILTKREKKVPIMQAICEKHGLNNEAQGIVFAMPVDNVMGLSME
jgi:nitrogen regulatory protein PII